MILKNCNQTVITDSVLCTFTETGFHLLAHKEYNFYTRTTWQLAKVTPPKQLFFPSKTYSIIQKYLYYVA